MGDFGHKIAYAVWHYISFGATNVIYGSKFTCSQNGRANCIKAYLKNSDDNIRNFKCAIYTDDNGPKKLVGQTGETAVAASETGAWYSCTFAAPPKLTAATVYWLVAWAADADALVGVQISYHAGTANQGCEKSVNYNNYPNPLEGELLVNDELSIYCEYTYIATYLEVKHHRK